MSLRAWTICFITTANCLMNQALAWGGRGHNTICEAAAFLTKEPGLGEFLTFRPHIMGHLCNIPDVHWKDLGGDAVKVGSPTHYFDADLLEVPVSDATLKYGEIEKKLQGKSKKKIGGTIKSVALEVGSLWWRADQFFRLAVQTPSQWSEITPPTNRVEEQNSDFPYNQVIYTMMVNMGLLGHYIGDNTQPLHTSADFDGWLSGHGGIHSYYEDQVVAALDHQLFAQVIKEGKRLQALSRNQKTKYQTLFITNPSVIEKCKALTVLAQKELLQLFKLDRVLSPSIVKSEKGLEIKTIAQRKSASQTARLFEKLIVQQMGRAASTLASIWDEIYRKAGRPNLSGYKSFRYPLKPDFVYPDYLSQRQD